MEARERGARVFHVDPRFSRTSAMATDYIRIRPGSDIAYLGGLIRFILEHGREFREYVTAYTNAPVIINEDFRDTEDLDGFFSGWDPETGEYDPSTWRYEGLEMAGISGQRESGVQEAHTAGAGGGKLSSGEPPA